MGDEFGLEEEQPKKTDGMEDLFRVDREELLDTEDLGKVDMNRDIIDANEAGNLDDLTEVDNEDIMGNIYGQSPLDSATIRRYRKKAARQTQPRFAITPSGLLNMR